MYKIFSYIAFQCVNNKQSKKILRVFVKEIVFYFAMTLFFICWGESKVLQYFSNVRPNLANPVAFPWL